MPESDWLTSIFTHALALFSGSGLTGLWVKRHFDRKERERTEGEEARKLALKLLPVMHVAERGYQRFLSDSIYLHDIDNEIRSSHLPTITVVKPDAALVKMIESSPVYLFESRYSSQLSGHKARLLVLASDLAEKQSTLQYDYDHPENLAVQAKDHLDRSLANIVAEFHALRRALSCRYLGAGSWSKSEARVTAEITEMQRRAYGIKTFSHRWLKLKERLAMAYLTYPRRFRRWLRSFGA